MPQAKPQPNPKLSYNQATKLMQINQKKQNQVKQTPRNNQT